VVAFLKLREERWTLDWVEAEARRRGSTPEEQLLKRDGFRTQSEAITRGGQLGARKAVSSSFTAKGDSPKRTATGPARATCRAEARRA
jgi:hypothetical protein